jgi:glutamate racemase
MDRNLPIGVFDSGVGGLTVVDAITKRLPGENILYLGDTARVPYGTRSPETVIRYAERVSGHLYRRGIKALVVACNTATTWAIDRLEAAGRDRGIPVMGVIEPGVQRALAATSGNHIGVIGTEGTIRGGVYGDRLKALRPGVRIAEQACPLFVALAEEGWLDGEVPLRVAEEYLAQLQDGPDTLILGCTHYPILKSVIAQVLPAVRLIDSASATADMLAAQLKKMDLLRPARMGSQHFLVTDNVERFRRTGAHFLKRVPEPVELADLDAVDEAAFAKIEPDKRGA